MQQPFLKPFIIMHKKITFLNKYCSKKNNKADVRNFIHRLRCALHIIAIICSQKGFLVALRHYGTFFSGYGRGGNNRKRPYRPLAKFFIKKQSPGFRNYSRMIAFAITHSRWNVSESDLRGIERILMLG